MSPVDLSSKKGIALFAKGDTDIRIMLFTGGGGRIPSIKTVHAGPEWTEIFLPWAAFRTEGKDVQILVITGPETGTVDFQIDEVRLK